MKIFWALLVIAEFTTLVIAQPRPPGPPPRTGDGPWNHRVLLATSTNGLDWTVGTNLVVEKASVPELFLGTNGLPVLLFVDASRERDQLSALVQQADGSWQPRAINLRGVDPNVVRLKDGSFRAYVKAGLASGAMDAYKSADGLDWRRMDEVFRDERYPNVTDPDVFETPDGWVMLLSLGPRLLRCTSTNGLSFTSGEVLTLGGAVSDTVKVSGGWRTFFHLNGDPQTGGRMRIRSAFTSDGKTWKVEAGERVAAPMDGPAKLGVADPAPVQLRDGLWLMAVKSFIELRQPPRFQPRPEFR